MKPEVEINNFDELYNSGKLPQNNNFIKGFIDPEILQQAIDKFGVPAQIEMVKEECIELALALQKLGRVRGNKEDKLNAVIDEIADVKIMLKQAEKMFPKNLIDKRVDFKMERLKGRINEGLM